MKRTISVLVENHPGVLSRISGLFSRRGFNIDSLAVGVTEDTTVSRITIVVDCNDYTLEQIEKQLNKLVDVIKLKTLDNNELIHRELMIIKVSADTKSRSDIMNIAEITGAKICDITKKTLTLEVADTAQKLENILELLRPYGIMEVVRTGTIALVKGHEKL